MYSNILLFKTRSTDKSHIFFTGGHDDALSYPDIIAMLIVLAMALIVAAGVRNSVLFNNSLNVINVLVWVFIVVTGLCFMDTDNWSNGFAPMGWDGVCDMIGKIG